MERISIVCLIAITAKRFSCVFLRRESPKQPVPVLISIAYVVVQRITKIYLIGVFQQYLIFGYFISITFIQRHIQPARHLMPPSFQQGFQPQLLFFFHRIFHIDEQSKKLTGLIVQFLYQHQFSQRLHRTVTVHVRQDFLYFFPIQKRQLFQILFRSRIQVERMFVQCGQLFQKRTQIFSVFIFIHRNLLYKFLPGIMLCADFIHRIYL